MKLAKLLENIDVLENRLDLETEICDVCYDSRNVKKGDLFVAIRGYATDGHKYIDKALEQGAAAIVCEEASENIPAVIVKNSRKALAQIGANQFDHPAQKLKMIGITGTNGKTTTTYLVKHVLESVGAKVGLIGTNQNMIGDEILETERTTPESYELQALFDKMVKAGCTHCVMEVSSHSLVLDRVYGVPFEVGAFTNLTQDHLDFHKTMEEYRKAKAILFTMCKKGILNMDDTASEKIMLDATCPIITYSAHDDSADLVAKNIELNADSVNFDVNTQNEKAHVNLCIPGQFTVSNALTAIGVCHALGVSLEKIAEALKTAQGVKGRVEVVKTDTDYTVLIDYAHSPDGVENVLKAVRGFTKGRVIALFGCGGDRDRTKRPKMGAIAANLADYCIVTSDNPRTEDPKLIIDDIIEGMKDSKTPYEVIVSRPEAIFAALKMAKKDDTIVLMGKGHETYQEINHVKHHMDEREIVAEYFKK